MIKKSRIILNAKVKISQLSKYLVHKNSFSKRSTPTIEEHQKHEEIITSPIRIESLLHKYYNVDNIAKKKMNFQKIAQNDSRYDPLLTSNYNKELVKKSNNINESSIKLKNEILINDKIQYSIKSTPRKVSNERDLISNKLSGNQNHHSKQNSVNTSKIIITSNIVKPKF